MSEPARRVCSICGEECDKLHRRFWFRRWEESLGTGEPLAEVQYLCSACRRRERGKALLYLAIVVIALAFVAAVLVMEFRKW
ncbi:MAG: hypothetical protein ACF8NJ_05860 [Phycisphaerales bacterium JB038]